MECVHPGTYSIELTDRSAVGPFDYYREQRSANTTNNIFPKCKKRVPPKGRAMQRVQISSFSRVMLASQAKRGNHVFVTSRRRAEKPMDCSAARGVQDIERIVLFHIIVTDFTREEKTVSRIHDVAMVEGSPKFTLSTRKKTKGDMPGVTKTSTQSTQKLLNGDVIHAKRHLRKAQAVRTTL